MVAMKAAPIVAAHLAVWQCDGVGGDHWLGGVGRIAT
jgi:hypothetical protein